MIAAATDTPAGPTAVKRFVGWIAYLPDRPAIEAEPIFGWTRAEVKDELQLRARYGEDVTPYDVRKATLVVEAPLDADRMRRLEQARRASVGGADA